MGKGLKNQMKVAEVLGFFFRNSAYISKLEVNVAEQKE